MFITPTVVGEAVYVGSCAGSFYALDQETGKSLWEYNTTSDGAASFHGDVLVYKGLLIFGTDSSRDGTGHIYALDRSTGKPKWNLPQPVGVPADVVRWKDRIFALTSAGNLLCLNPLTGRLHWSAEPETQGIETQIRLAAVVWNDLVIFTSPDGYVLAVHAESGEEVWSKRLGSMGSTKIVLFGDQIVFGTEEGVLYGLDAASGESVFQFDLGGDAQGMSLAHESRVYVVVRNLGLVAFNLETHDVDWEQSSDYEWTSPLPKVHEGSIWVGNKEGELYGYDLDQGTPKDYVEVSGMIRGFAFEGDNLWIGTFGGTLYKVLKRK